MGEAPLPQRARGYWRARISAAGEGLERLLEAERAQLPPWAVVGLGSGIAAWFALGEPRPVERLPLRRCAALALLGFALGSGRARAGRSAGSRWRRRSAARWFGLARAWVEQPRLTRPVVAEFSGTVETVDHLAAQGSDTRLSCIRRRRGCRRSFACRSTTTSFRRESRQARRFACAPGSCRRRRWRCPAPTISRATPGSRVWAAWASRSALSRSFVAGKPQGLDRARAGFGPISRTPARKQRRNCRRARHRRPECRGPGRCRRDAPAGSPTCCRSAAFTLPRWWRSRCSSASSCLR